MRRAGLGGGHGLTGWHAVREQGEDEEEDKGGEEAGEEDDEDPRGQGGVGEGQGG